MTSLAITFDDVARAHERIAGIAHRTTVVTSATANTKTGASVFFKCETLQHSGAFKIRGAYNAVSQFTKQQREGGVEPTGCLAAAAVLTGKIDVKGKRVGVVLSGGNIDLERFAVLVNAPA